MYSLFHTLIQNKRPVGDVAKRQKNKAGIDFLPRPKKFSTGKQEKTKTKSPRGFLPRPLLRADKMQKQISLGFAKIHIPRK
jgi:hypothetical protein